MRRPALRRASRTAVVALALVAVLAALPAHDGTEGAVAGLASVPQAEAARNYGAGPVDDVLYWADQKKACGLTRDQLAALTMVPSFTETQAPTNTTPSPMTLSRYDTASGLYAFSTPGLANKAFFHPGISAWQLDSAGFWPLSAYTAINSFTASSFLVGFLVQRYCQSTSSTAAGKRTYAWFPWSYCSTTSRCETVYQSLLDGNGTLLYNRDASVTSLGGMENRTCEVAGLGSVSCGFVDPARAQGLATWNQPGFGLSPITAPFYVFEHGGKEYRYWLKADTGYAQTIRASKAITANARTGLTWAYGETLCDRTAGRGTCGTPPPGGYIAWSGWGSFGLPMSGTPAVAANADGRLEWFAIGDDTVLYHAWQTTPGGSWSPLQAMTGWLPPTGSVTVGTNADGRLEVFIQAADNRFWRAAQMAPNSAWGSFSPIDGSFPTASRPALGTNEDGRLELYVIGGDQAMWHAWQLAPNGSFGEFASMGGGFVGAPAVVLGASGRQELFGVGTAGGLWHGWQAIPNGGWTTWAYRGGSPAPSQRLVAARNPDGRLEVFAIGAGNALFHLWQVTPSGSWSPWESLGGAFPRGFGLVTTSDGRFEVMAAGGDGRINNIFQYVVNGGWGAWSIVGSASVGQAPIPFRNATGLLSVFAVGIDRSLGRSDQYWVP